MKKIIIGLLSCVVVALLTVVLATTLLQNPDGTNSNISTASSTESERGNTSTENSSENDVSGESETSLPTVSQPSEKKIIKFAAVGDNIMHTSILYDAEEKAASGQKYNFDPIYSDIYDYIKSKDIAYVNVETLIGGPSKPVDGYPKFNSPEEIGEYLIEMGFDVMNLAHNHMLDSGDTTFLKYCDNFFRTRGTLPIGYYKDTDDLDNIPIYEEQGVKIAFLAYTYGTNGYVKGANDPTYIPLINDELIKKQVRLAKEKGDLVFVSMHWGIEDSWGGTNQVFPPDAEQKRVAQLLIDEGVDVIIGMHPHVLQEAKWVERKDGGRTFLVYSIGNLVSGMYWGRNMVGAMLELDIVVENGNVSVENPMLIPIVTHYRSVYGTKFRDFKIYLLEDYTEELAAAHGCHLKDDPLASTSTGRKKFTLESIYSRVKGTFAAEFLPDYLKS